MLAKRLRLPAEELEDTRSWAKNSSSFFIARKRPRRLLYARFAVIVGIKVDKRSSMRHLLKRRVATELYKHREGAHDIIVSVLPAARDLPAKVFKKQLMQII